MPRRGGRADEPRRSQGLRAMKSGSDELLASRNPAPLINTKKGPGATCARPGGWEKCFDSGAGYDE